jgi:hypothetical protein
MGTDLDSRSIAFACKRRVDAILTHAETLCSALPQLEFDLVLSSKTFEHVTSLPQSFQSLQQLTFRRTVIIVPNALGLVTRAKENATHWTMLR